MEPVKPIIVEIAGKPRKLVRSLATIVYMRELAENESAVYADALGGAKGGDPQAAYMRAYPYLIHSLLGKDDREELTPDVLMYEVPLEEAMAAGKAVMGLLSDQTEQPKPGAVDLTKKKRAPKN